MPIGTGPVQHAMLTVARPFVPGWPRPRRPAPIIVGIDTLSITINCRSRFTVEFDLFGLPSLLSPAQSTSVFYVGFLRYPAEPLAPGI